MLGGASPESLVPQTTGTTYTITGTAIPISLVVPPLNLTPAPLQELWMNGQFMAPVTASRNVLFGMLAEGKPPKGSGPLIREAKSDFSRHDVPATVYISLQSMNTLKTTVRMRMYDADNRVISNGEPSKVTLRRGESHEWYWSFAVGSLNPAIYRVDVLVGESVAWRTYFRVRE